MVVRYGKTITSDRGHRTFVSCDSRVAVVSIFWRSCARSSMPRKIMFAAYHALQKYAEPGVIPSEMASTCRLASTMGFSNCGDSDVAELKLSAMTLATLLGRSLR